MNPLDPPRLHVHGRVFGADNCLQRRRPTIVVLPLVVTEVQLVANSHPLTANIRSSIWQNWALHKSRNWSPAPCLAPLPPKARHPILSRIPALRPHLSRLASSAWTPRLRWNFYFGHLTLPEVFLISVPLNVAVAVAVRSEFIE